MTCKECTKSSVKDGYCRTHYIEYKESQYLDNSNVNKLGIELWLKDMLPEHFRNDVAEHHREAFISLLRLYDPVYTNRFQRQRGFIWFRGGGKTTVMMGFFAYIIAHNRQKVKIQREDGEIIEVMIKESFILIASETGGQAETSVNNIRTEFATNPMLKYFYKFIIENATEDNLSKEWTKRAFKINNTYILGVGQGMQIRGRIKGAYRITFALLDDIYSENNTKTEDSRRNIKNWFDNALLNTLDNIEGKVALINTIVHEDTVVVECMKNKLWRIIKKELMPIDKFREFVEKHLETNSQYGICRLPFDDEENEFLRIQKQREYFEKYEKDNIYQVAWNKIKLYDIALQYQDAVLKGQISGFYQEYFHQIIPQENKRFLPEYFKKITEYRIFKEYGYVWFECKELYDEPQICNVEFGLDTSTGTLDGDDTCITVVCTVPDQRVFVLRTVYGKFSLRDILYRDDKEIRYNKVMMDETKIRRKGFIDETFRLALIYYPSKIKIGVAGQEKHFPIEMERVLKENGLYEIQVIPMVQTVADGKKFERIKNILIGKYETLMVYHAPGLTKLEHQLEYLGKANEDDIADATSVAFWNLQRIYQIDYTMFSKPVIPKKKLPFKTLKELQMSEIKNDWRIN